LCIAEDQPQAANGCSVDWSVRDAYGLPQLVIDHHYSPRDRGGVERAGRRARRLAPAHRRGDVCYTHRVKTFSHALGRCGWARSRDLAARRGLPVSQRHQPVDHRRQRAADVGQRQPEPDDRGERCRPPVDR
jgi:hypothetical protein